MSGSGTVNSGVPPEIFPLSEAFEGFSATPYKDSAGVWTIGIGSIRDAQGNPVTEHTPAITHAQAEQLTARDLSHAADLLKQDFPNGLPARWWSVGVLMNNNLGRMSVWGATLLGLLQAKNWTGAASQMKVYRNAGGHPVLGLRRRRWTEAAYAMGMEAKAAYNSAWANINDVEDWPPFP